MVEICARCQSELASEENLSAALIAISGLWVGKGKVESKLDRLEIRDKVTHGRKVWGYISDDRKLIISDSGDVWVRTNTTEVE